MFLNDNAFSWRIAFLSYYSQKLAADRLKQVYAIAPRRIRQYLDSELNHVIAKLHPTDLVLDLGCGYGRTLPQLAARARWVIGIDISAPSLQLARKLVDGVPNVALSQMNAANLSFRGHTFDCVVCIQNGISAFHVDPRLLISESLRIAKPKSLILFSTYAAKFWEERLKWFQLQSETGLLGEIDYDKTKEGVIICKDGFTATTVDQDGFSKLTKEINATVRIEEVDESSLFCEIVPHA